MCYIHNLPLLHGHSQQIFISSLITHNKEKKNTETDLELAHILALAGINIRTAIVTVLHMSK